MKYEIVNPDIGLWGSDMPIRPIRLTASTVATVTGRFFPLIAGFLISACSLAPSPMPPVPESVVNVPDEFSGSEVAGSYEPLEWWKSFGDPVLDEVIQEVLTSNFDLVAAVARVDQARMLARIARAPVFPLLQPSASGIDFDAPTNAGIGAQFDELGLGSALESAAGIALPDRLGLTTYSLGKDFTPSAIDVTRRFLRECLRMYPIVPMSMRDVMNACVVEGYEIPVGTRLYIAQMATHYMGDVFPDPFSFDIDRYLPPRSEHRGPGYAPYGLGTHTCLGSRWMDLRLTVNVLMVAHYFTLEVSPANYELRFSPLPSMKPSKALKFHIAEQKRELPV